MGRPVCPSASRIVVSDHSRPFDVFTSLSDSPRCQGWNVTYSGTFGAIVSSNPCISQCGSKVRIEATHWGLDEPMMYTYGCTGDTYSKVQRHPGFTRHCAWRSLRGLQSQCALSAHSKLGCQLLCQNTQARGSSSTIDLDSSSTNRTLRQFQSASASQINPRDSRSDVSQEPAGHTSARASTLRRVIMKASMILGLFPFLTQP
mmetsp:Transcript_29025/g.86680  ORF Transcript_29025/g.86680 Transcript_29025/m.86680 type:complete len:203 (+) Transcript_29025:1563-2171(+)